MDDPMPIAPGLAIPLAEIELRATRSSGPGGQHANVTASRIEAVFDVEASNALEARNRELALERLRDKLANGLRELPPRRPTRPTRSARERRLEEKRRTAQRKRERRPPDEE
jgi:ribosome-associated protein